MAGGDSSGTDPRRLEGRSEDSRPREFFWDTVDLNIEYCVNGCVAELERLLLTGKSQMRVTEPFRGNWARAETADGSYKLTDWTHAIRTVQTQVKSTVASRSTWLA